MGHDERTRVLVGIEPHARKRAARGDRAPHVVLEQVGERRRGAAQARVGDFAERRGHLTPMLVRDDRDLALAALIGVADDALAGDDLRALRGIHRSAMRALDPDLY